MKKVVCILLAVAMLAVFAGCDSTSGKLEKIQKNGKIIIYTDPNFPPFEFMASDGVKGVDVEIGKAIAEELGVQVEFQEGKFDSIIMSIKGGKGDIAISGFSITEERRQSVDFSETYINSVQYLILPEGSALKTVEDLAGKKVGVAKGYTGSLLIDDEINADEGVLKGKGTAFTEYPSAMEAVLDMNNKKVDAVVMDEYVAKSIVSKQTGLIAVELTYADGALASEEYGVVVPKNNPDLLKKINDVVNKLKSEGKIQEWVVTFSE